MSCQPKREAFLLDSLHVDALTELIADGYIPEEKRAEALLRYLFARREGDYHDTAYDEIIRTYYPSKRKMPEPRKAGH